MKYTFELPWNYSEENYEQFLTEHNVIHLKSHDEKCFKVGDALRSSKGVVARIMERFANYENCSIDYTIANNKLDTMQIYEQFGYQSIKGKIDAQFQHDLQLRHVSPEVGWVDQDEEYY